MRLEPHTRLLDFARELQRATSFLELLQITRDEVERELGYHHVWLAVLDSADHSWPVETPNLLAPLVDDWLRRIDLAE